MLHPLLAVLLLLGGSSAIDPEDPYTNDEYYMRSQQALADRVGETIHTGKSRRLILFVGDGFGPTAHLASRIWAGQQEGLVGGEEYETTLDELPFSAVTRTHSVDHQTADSATTAASFFSGVKQKNEVLNCKPTMATNACTAAMNCNMSSHGIKPFAHELKAAGVAAGVVTTTRVTHATPAAAYSNSASRDWESSTPCPEQTDIGTQLYEAMESGAIRVAMGGGIRSMLLRENGGQRDDVDLVALMEESESNFTVATNMSQFTTTDFSQVGAAPVFVGFKDDPMRGSHMYFEADRVSEEQPSLVEMTVAAIEAMEAGNHEQWFLMIEAGRIDQALHNGNLARAVEDSRQLQRAIAAAIEVLDPADSTIFSTADHGHGLQFVGYCGRGSDPLGHCRDGDGASTGWNVVPAKETFARDSRGTPMLTSAFTTGPGAPNYVGTPLNEVTGEPMLRWDPGTPPSEEEATSLDFLQPALHPKSSEAHSGEDVVTYGWGTRANVIRGTVDNTFIHFAMKYALDI